MNPTPPIQCFLSLGSNLSNPLQQINQAIQSIGLHSKIVVIRTASMYKNPAIGPGKQPNYINTVIEIETLLPCLNLLHFTQEIELEQGRTRTALRWTARTIDIDILLYGDQSISSEELTVPHPRLKERAFVIYPLYDIAPSLKLDKNTSIKDIKSSLCDKKLEKIPISI
jgi:2-amino-4-hydroxy-6-hydroxymethyldihydropteridine diphosphokinase